MLSNIIDTDLFLVKMYLGGNIKLQDEGDI